MMIPDWPLPEVVVAFVVGLPPVVDNPELKQPVVVVDKPEQQQQPVVDRHFVDVVVVAVVQLLLPE